MPKKCCGWKGKACVFGAGGKAKQVGRGQEACLWCRPPALEEECLMKTKRGALVKQFRAMSAEQHAVAKKRLHAEHVPLFESGVSKRCIGTEGGEACSFAQTWALQPERRPSRSAFLRTFASTSATPLQVLLHQAC